MIRPVMVGASNGLEAFREVGYEAHATDHIATFERGVLIHLIKRVNELEKQLEVLKNECTRD
jgi:hypothetical protein